MNPIVAYFLIITLLMVYLLMRTEGANAIKVAVVAALFYVSSAVWFSFDSYRGWPTNVPPQQDLVLLSVIIFEETKKTPGAIYATGIPCVTDRALCDKYAEDDGILARLSPYKAFGYASKARNTPRTYEFEYNEENRKAFAQAQANIEKGGRSTLRVGKQEEGVGSKGGRKGSGDETAEPAEEGARGDDAVENSGIEGAPDILNEAPEDLMRKD